ncbi:phage holin family protein [Litoreibacter albidus]|uniref:Putative Holin-X, holin superfamily III n=1 Tax=Litoreibacter albidus TaxID=670155 RepID=A0A1H3BT75_9RHOB|nr:phage holin family protein [Litoreibacter albidus]SDX44965.1 Putative Holin-X, holin superfamily III [Litoreibacter albidus]
MFEAIEYKAKTAARKVALSSLGGLMLAVGLGFLTAAAWMYVTLIADAMTAALVIGGAYVGLGLILMGLSSARKVETHHATPTPASSQPPPLMQAFLQGMQAGAQAQRR